MRETVHVPTRVCVHVSACVCLVEGFQGKTHLLLRDAFITTPNTPVCGADSGFAF